MTTEPYELDLNKYPGMRDLTVAEWVEFAISMGFSGNFKIEITRDFLRIEQ
jgi:hypothetical protein